MDLRKLIDSKSEKKQRCKTVVEKKIEQLKATDNKIKKDLEDLAVQSAVTNIINQYELQDTLDEDKFKADVEAKIEDTKTMLLHQLSENKQQLKELIQQKYNQMLNKYQNQNKDDDCAAQEDFDRLIKELKI